MALRYLLDTNICIYIAKQKPTPVLKKFEQLTVGEVGISGITYGELYYGAQKSHASQKSLALLDELIHLIPPIPLSTATAKQYGLIRRTLEKQGTPIGNNDLWIAAHSLDLQLTLVTNNVKEFSRIPHLTIENWVD
jgi:tRNA(fMet)-specific endonuclease VapC